MASTTLLLMADYIFWLKSHNCTTKGSLCLHCESLLLKYPIKHLKVTFLFTEMTRRSAQRGWRESIRGIDWLHSPPSRFCCPLPFCSVLVIILSLSLSFSAGMFCSFNFITVADSQKVNKTQPGMITCRPPSLPHGPSRPLLGYSGPFPCSPLLNYIDNSLTGHSRSQEILSVLFACKPIQQGHRSPTDSPTASYKLPPNERISLKCRACLSASLFLKGGEEAGHRGEKVQAFFQQNSESTKQHFSPHKEPPRVNICTKLNVRSIRARGTGVNVNVMVMSYL